MGLVPSVVAALAACDGSGPETAPTPNLPPWGEAAWPMAPTPDPKKAALGRLLFYDPILGADEETACATCHSELWGMSDGLRTSIGVGGGTLTGPGRRGESIGPRNSQTLWNVAFRELLFADGRERSLEDQVLVPLHSPIELAKDPDDVLADLSTIEEYRRLFAEAFADDNAPDGGSPVTLPRLQKALAEFQRTLITDRSPYDRWVAGDSGALSDEMLLGMERFAELGCPSCHVPPLFESETFHRRRETGDPGRMALTRDESDRGAFRVPTLRNVRMTEPYFHDGSVPTLEEAIRHEAALSGYELSLADERAISAFLGRGLIDRSREPFRPAIVPSGLPVPLDGFRILRP